VLNYKYNKHIDTATFKIIFHVFSAVGIPAGWSLKPCKRVADTLFEGQFWLVCLRRIHQGAVA